jgi:hypothetical protein
VWTIQEAVEGNTTWRTSAVPNDATRIHYVGHDADGTFVNSIENPAFAETVEEARIVIDVLRAGTDHLPGWREQLEAAGFERKYPEEDGILACMWSDRRRSGHFDITVLEGDQQGFRTGELSVSATYQAQGSNSWHNVCQVDGSAPHVFGMDKPDGGRFAIRSGLPEGIDALKAGVAATIAIHAARTARGGRFATPLGGPTRKSAA